MANLTARLLDPETFEEALQDPDFCCCIEGRDAIRELHARLRTAKEEDDLTFNRGWNAAKAEITAALGCDWEGIYLAAKEPWALKVAQLVETAKAEGAAEALRSLANTWHHHSGHVTLPEAYPRPCQTGCTKCFILAEAKMYDDRAAAIRKGIEGRAGGGK